MTLVGVRARNRVNPLRIGREAHYGEPFVQRSRRVQHLGQPHQLVGAAEIEVTGVAEIERAGPGDLAFCLIGGNAGISLLEASIASVVVAPDVFAGFVPDRAGRSVVLVPNPRLALADVVTALFTEPAPQGIHETAIIDPSAELGSRVHVGPYCVIGAGVRIGDDSVLHAHVTIYPKTVIGERAVIHSGAVLGADAFTFEADSAGRKHKLPSLGRVIIEDDVEIGAASCIDRGTFEDTVLGKGVKLDNLVHIGHGAVVGAGALLPASVTLSGNVVIGENAWIGVSSVLKQRLRVGADALVGMGSVVTKNVDARTTVAGVPARYLRANVPGRTYQPPAPGSEPDSRDPHED